ncbi:MAG: metallophosphoesterase [Clostridia bacterium]|nr:metallophosphoesterase [Clostridia bacterium]
MKRALTLLCIFVILTGVAGIFCVAGSADAEICEITLGDFTLAGVGARGLYDSRAMLSQRTVIAVPYVGTSLRISINRGYQVRIHSGSPYGKMTEASDWFGSADRDVAVSYTLPEKSIYMRASIKRADGRDIDIGEYESAGLRISYECKTNIITANEDVAKILTETDDPVIIHISDIHGDVIRAERAAAFADHVNAAAVLASGDLTVYNRSDWGSALFDAMDKYPDNIFMYTLGNHDAINAPADNYGAVMDDAYYKNNPYTPEGVTYYYRDLDDEMLRIISVNQQEGARTARTGGTCFSQAQIDWLVETLKTTPEGFGVLLMYHSPEISMYNKYDPDYMEFFQLENRYDQPTNVDSGYSGTILTDIVDAFILRTKFTATYSERRGESPVKVNADFTDVADGVEFIAHLTGHYHADTVTYLPGGCSKQLMLGGPCTVAAYGDIVGNPCLADYSDADRHGDVKAHDDFNAYIIDRKTKTIRVLKIGADRALNGESRSDMTIPYTVPFEEGEYPFSTESKVQLDLDDVNWVNYGTNRYGPDPSSDKDVRWSQGRIFEVPYDGAVLYVKINAPYELSIRSGSSVTAMTTEYSWLNNKPMSDTASDRGFVYKLPKGHKFFCISVANITRDSRQKQQVTEHDMNLLDLGAAGVELWYEPEPSLSEPYLFSTNSKIRIDMEGLEWLNYGIQTEGLTPLNLPGKRISPGMIFDVPYDGAILYVKVNSPYEVCIRTGPAADRLTNNRYWFNNKCLSSGDYYYGYAYKVPSGHTKFAITVANMPRTAYGNVESWNRTISLDELDACGVEIWYEPCGHSFNQGTCSICGLYEPPFKLIEEPPDVSAAIGDSIKVSVKAEGNDLLYHWFFKNKDGDKFIESDCTVDSYECVMNSFCDGREIYCVISSPYGYDDIKTDTVTITAIHPSFKITKEPESVIANIGDQVTVSVTAEGEGLRYIWYEKDAGEDEFRRSDAKTRKYRLKMEEECNGREVYCVITDKNGDELTTSPATISRPGIPVSILYKSPDVLVSALDSFTLTVEAVGDGLTYEWYYQSADENRIKKAPSRSPILTGVLPYGIASREYCCVVTDMFGNHKVTGIIKVSQNFTPLKNVEAVYYKYYLWFAAGPGSAHVGNYDFNGGFKPHVLCCYGSLANCLGLYLPV